MKRLSALLVLLFFWSILPGLPGWAAAPVIKDLIVKESPYVDVRAHSTLALALTATANKTLLVASTVNISANTTIPSNVAVMVMRGGSFAIATGVTLTIDGPFDAGLYQVFSGTGVVRFGVSSIADVYPEWWGDVTINASPEIQFAGESIANRAYTGKATTDPDYGHNAGRIVFNSPKYVMGLNYVYSWTSAQAVIGAGVDLIGHNAELIQNYRGVVVADANGRHTSMLDLRGNTTMSGLTINGNAVNTYPTIDQNNPAIDFIQYVMIKTGGSLDNNYYININNNTFINSPGSFFGYNGRNLKLTNNNFGCYGDHIIYYAEGTPGNNPMEGVIFSNNTVWAQKDGDIPVGWTYYCTRDPLKFTGHIKNITVNANTFHIPNILSSVVTAAPYYDNFTGNEQVAENIVVTNNTGTLNNGTTGSGLITLEGPGDHTAAALSRYKSVIVSGNSIDGAMGTIGRVNNGGLATGINADIINISNNTFGFDMNPTTGIHGLTGTGKGIETIIIKNNYFKRDNAYGWFMMGNIRNAFIEENIFTSGTYNQRFFEWNGFGGGLTYLDPPDEKSSYYFRRNTVLGKGVGFLWDSSDGDTTTNSLNSNISIHVEENTMNKSDNNIQVFGISSTATDPIAAHLYMSGNRTIDDHGATSLPSLDPDWPAALLMEVAISSWAPGVIPADNTVSTTITVPGATTGDFVVWSVIPDTDLTGCVVRAVVTSANTVTLSVLNTTSSNSANIDTTVWRLRAIKSNVSKY